MTKPGLITLTNPRSRATEAYRSLRTNLNFSSLNAPLQTLLVTSVAPGEGGSLAVANLAVTMAQGGKRTILVDCDLRKPAQHDIWGLSREPGLTTMMLENMPEPPICDVGVENLWVLPSGPTPPNPADLLGSPAMGLVVEQLREMADIVLFDAPPVIAVTDAALLATQLDGVLLVLRAGSTRRDYAERAKELLERVNVRIVGVVLTNAQVDSKVSTYGS